jgi:hypothetical protein
MPVKKLKSGKFSIRSEEDARAALQEMKQISEEITTLMVEHGIVDLQEKASKLKEAATDWAVENDQDVINLGGSLYARLRRDKYGGTWIATDSDITEETPVGVVPLRMILKKKIKDQDRFREVWNRVTRRAVDTQGLDRVVAEGILTAEEAGQAFYEKDKKPFIQVYGG